ncbi:MAG: peptidyl-prolyl cis-trans isomerase [Halarcobacter sp.]
MMKQVGILQKGTRLLFILLTVLTFSHGSNLIDAVALVVNDEPITLFDIEKRKYQKKISKEKAVSQLIDEVLYEQLVEKYNITADIFDINSYLEKIAASNGMDLYTFKSVLRQKYKNYDRYEEEVRNTIIKEKLTEKLVRGNIKIATEEDLKIYYENNKSMFEAAANVKAIQYVSPNRESLISITKNPMMEVDDVTKTPVNLEQAKLNPQLRYVINGTKINHFTPIFNANKDFVTLLITKKENLQTIAYADVRDRIFNIVMQDRQQKYLKDYFEKLKLSADIKIVR